MKLRKTATYLMVFAALTACNVSFNAGDMESANAPKVIEDLPPLSKIQFEYASNALELFYETGFDGIRADIHPLVANEFDGLKAKAIEKLRSKSADLDKAVYFGHGFGQERGIEFTVIQFKVPADNGYDLVRLVVSDEGNCCQIAGINVERQYQKSIKLGGK